LANILIATLGESPIVVTAMVDLLRAHGVAIDEVVLIYPDEPTDRYIWRGREFITEALAGICNVSSLPLPFEDPNSEEHSVTFLWLVANELRIRESQGDAVYLSIAGGRKNMSALLVLLPQFYSCVRGLYHLHNPYDEDSPRRHLYTIEALDHYTPAKRIEHLHPPLDDFKFVELPCETVARSVALMRWLEQAGDTDASPAIPVRTPEAESFYGRVFRHARRPAKMLDLRFTQSAYDQYCELAQGRSEQRRVFDEYFALMRDPWFLSSSNGKHGSWKASGKRFHFCKRPRTAERPFFYTLPGPIDLFPRRAVNEVVICGLSREVEGTYVPPAQHWLDRGDFEPVKALADLPARAKDQPIALIAPLGLSPAVVTQAYVLLQRQGFTVAGSTIIYPGNHPAIRGGAEMLEMVCARRGIRIESQPLPIADVDDKASCDIFLSGLQETILRHRERHPEEGIALLISGGRKAMSALTLIAAQAMGVDRVYHTVIDDPQIERRVQAETAYETLRSCMPGEQARALLLERRTADELEHITVFAVPVLHLQTEVRR